MTATDGASAGDASRRTVLVTGVSRHLGARVARHLSLDPRVDHVVGIDAVPPRSDIGRAEFVRADLRTPAVSRVVAAHAIDTVVHAGVLQTPTSAGSRAAMKDINVMGTLQLIAACQRVSTVKRFVLKSSTAVYGSGPEDPAVFRESDDAVATVRSGFPRDSVDVEDAARRFARTCPDVQVCLLRMANVVGPGMETPLMRYLRMRLAPTVLGFDPRLQVLHEDDAVTAMQAAVFSDVTGAVNIAAEGVVTLSQALACAGRLGVPLPGPIGRTVGGALRRFGIVEFAPEDIGFLTYGRVVDTERMRSVLGVVPTYSTAEALATVADGYRGDATTPVADGQDRDGAQASATLRAEADHG